MDTRTCVVFVWLGFHFSLSWLACHVLIRLRHTLPSAYKLGLKRARPCVCVHVCVHEWVCVCYSVYECMCLPSAYKLGLKRAQPCTCVWCVKCVRVWVWLCVCVRVWVSVYTWVRVCTFAQAHTTNKTQTQTHNHPMRLFWRVFHRCVGLARTINIRCIYGIFGLRITKYTVYTYVYIRSWPTLQMCDGSHRSIILNHIEAPLM